MLRISICTVQEPPIEEGSVLDTGALMEKGIIFDPQFKTKHFLLTQNQFLWAPPQIKAKAKRFYLKELVPDKTMIALKICELSNREFTTKDEDSLRITPSSFLRDGKVEKGYACKLGVFILNLNYDEMKKYSFWDSKERYLIKLSNDFNYYDYDNKINLSSTPITYDYPIGNSAKLQEVIKAGAPENLLKYWNDLHSVLIISESL